MKKIQSKKNALERSQVYHYFFERQRAANSVVNNGILTKFKLIQAFVTSKYEEDLLKMKALECLQYFSHYKPMRIFPGTQGALTHQLEV